MSGTWAIIIIKFHYKNDHSTLSYKIIVNDVTIFFSQDDKANDI